VKWKMMTVKKQTAAERIAQKYGKANPKKLSEMIARYGTACARRAEKFEADARKEAYVQVALLRRRLEALELHIPALLCLAKGSNSTGVYDREKNKVQQAPEIIASVERALASPADGSSITKK